MDRLSPAERSENMRRIRSRNTTPEKTVRNILRALRFKFHSHKRDLPGRPDFVFAKRRKVLFVHGCFWHFHRRCRIGRIPKSRVNYWVLKLEGNKKRDLRNKARLKYRGWKVLTIWECQLGDLSRVRRLIKAFLSEKKLVPSRIKLFNYSELVNPEGVGRSVKRRYPRH
jgi:DNA mismatch endonuclease (patch repair protein)